MTKLTSEQLDLIRREWHTHTSGAIVDLFAHIDAITAELSQAQAEIELFQTPLDILKQRVRAEAEARAEVEAELAALRAGVPDGWVLVPTADNWADADPGCDMAEVICNAARVCGGGALDIYRDLLAAAPQPPAQATEAFQDRVAPWMHACFGPEISGDRLERGDRFLEEALELLQSGDYPRERVAALTDYVFGRSKGEPAQEVGGVMVTLAAYCLAHGLDMHASGEAELARIWTKVDVIRAKQAAKPVGSALPMVAQPAQAVAVEVRPAEWKMGDEYIPAIGPYLVHGDNWYLGQDYMGTGGKVAAEAHLRNAILSAIDARPESAVKAEALREVAAEWGRGQPEYAAMAALARALNEHADRLEREGK